MVYITIRANVPRLRSNFKFISSFTDPEDMADEKYCFFTHLQSAVAFIEMVNDTSLNIDKSSYDQFMKKNMDKMRSRRRPSLLNKFFKPAPPADLP
jgi:hypothetical protein